MFTRYMPGVTSSSLYGGGLALSVEDVVAAFEDELNYIAEKYGVHIKTVRELNLALDRLVSISDEEKNPDVNPEYGRVIDSMERVRNEIMGRLYGKEEDYDRMLEELQRVRDKFFGTQINKHFKY